MIGFGRRRAFVTWARRHAVPLDLDDAAGSARRLAGFDPLLAGKELVFLGEANHFVHEKGVVREILLRWLHAAGVRLVGEELSAADGARVARFVETGDAAALERVTTYGYTGCRREDRDDEPRGILAERLRTHPGRAFRAQHTRLAACLRELGGVRFFGFDVDYEPGAGYERLADEGLIEAAPPALRRVRGETLEEEVARLESAWAALRAARAAGPLLRRVRTLARSHAYLRALYAAESYTDLAPAFAIREDLMLEHVREALADAGPGAVCALLSHDLHLARRDEGIALGRGVGPGGGRGSLGARLSAERPSRVFTVWTLDGGGRSGPGEGTPIPTPRRSSLNALLGRVGGCFALPVQRAPLLDRELELAFHEGIRARLRLGEQADLLVYVRRVGPLRDAP